MEEKYHRAEDDEEKERQSKYLVGEEITARNMNAKPTRQGCQCN